jgi:hypothetical protein
LWNPTLRLRSGRAFWHGREKWGTLNPKINGKGKTKVKGVGPFGCAQGRQECPTHTGNFNTNSKGNPEINPKVNPKVKCVGQECPTHTGNFNTNSKGNPEINPEINPKVKGVGQECPTHTGKVSIMICRWRVCG